MLGVYPTTGKIVVLKYHIFFCLYYQVFEFISLANILLTVCIVTSIAKLAGSVEYADCISTEG